MKIKMDLIKKINADYVWKKVNLAGWIVHIRFSGKIGFVEFRDGTGYIQCIAEEKNIWEDKFNELKNCGIESSIKISGTVSKHPKKDEYEIQTEDFEVISLAKDYPLWQKDHGVEFLFDNRHLYLRSKSQWAIQRVRDEVIHATYDWMQENDFTKIDSPIFTSTCAEDSTSLYETTHTNWETMYLNQTGQMYIEAAIAAHRNVYDFWPVFRAERSKTRRHLNELWMMDAEEAFTDNEWNMKYQEDLIYYIVQRVLKNKRAELEIIGRDISKLEKIQKPFIRKTHAEVVKELQAMWSDIKEWDDLWADDETLLMNKYEQPVFVTNFPLEIKAFYMPEDPKHPGTAKCADLLAPEWYGEIIWWSERIWDYETLKKRILDHGYKLEDYEWYLDIRKYGWVTTSGFGYGLERLVMWICGLQHIREAIPFPRYHNRIRP